VAQISILNGTRSLIRIIDGTNNAQGLVMAQTTGDGHGCHGGGRGMAFPP